MHRGAGGGGGAGHLPHPRDPPAGGQAGRDGEGGGRDLGRLCSDHHSEPDGGKRMREGLRRRD